MATESFEPSPPALLLRKDFSQLIQVLQNLGYRILGPVLSNGAIQWDEITREEDLPIGWKDQQHPGNYRLEPDPSARYFNIVHGPQSLKPLVFSPRETLLVLDRNEKTFSAKEIIPDIPRTAVLGVRACDLAGLGIQDQIFLKGPYPDPYYQQRRNNLFLIAVNCTRALETCFCASMGTGPKARGGYDLSLTEADEDFAIQAGSIVGLEVLDQLACAVASQARIQQDDERIAACAASQTRTIPHASLPHSLYEAHDHSRWDEVAARCLACTNCTMVCPTCFCHGVEETPTLDHQQSEHARVWDSCFTSDHGYIHGKNFRPTTKDRYRMWLTHKLGSWIDQFGMSGCVGCGRCMTWCPVGIDLTEEVHALCQQPS
ncbi:MAG TPA: 4Fe-4S dicluster domain-containing protein [Nitrospirales bacterium]|nr:4Fe-4S dicluster domain-containing protein [Nitrospira sp. MA-1]HNP61130.1 4Fe-4S dicluster domain-containing protein [Nitrospirales bacterium]